MVNACGSVCGSVFFFYIFLWLGIRQHHLKNKQTNNNNNCKLDVVEVQYVTYCMMLMVPRQFLLRLLQKSCYGF